MFIMLKFVHSLYNRGTATVITSATDISLKFSEYAIFIALSTVSQKYFCR